MLRTELLCDTARDGGQGTLADLPDLARNEAQRMSDRRDVTEIERNADPVTSGGRCEP